MEERADVLGSPMDRCCAQASPQQQLPWYERNSVKASYSHEREKSKMYQLTEVKVHRKYV
jgi:hypothetical protein